MPIRGETVGTAFVRILADGSELGPGIADQLRDHDDAFKAQGERSGESYAKAFEESVKKSPTWAKMMKDINQSIANEDATRQFFQGPAWKNIEDEMENRFGPEIGKRLAIGLENEFRQRGALSGLESELKRLTPRVVAATKDIQKEEKKVADEFERSVRREFESIDREISTINRDIDRNLNSHQAALRRTENAFRASFRAISVEGRKSVHVLDDFIARTKHMDKETTGTLRRISHRFDSVAEGVGRLFGRGSRNNFLNFFGSIITNTLKFGGALIKTFDKIFEVASKVFVGIADFIGDLRKQFAEAGTAAEKFAVILGEGGLEGALTTVITGGLNLVAGLALLGLAFGAVAITIGALVSALVLLGGIIIALAASIEATLIVAVAALAPLLLPIAGIVLGIVAAVKEFKDATGDLKTAMKKVKTEAKSLFETFKDRAFKRAPELTERIAKAMKNLDPFVKAAGKGFNRFGGVVVKALTSPSIDAFVDRFERFLPSAMKRLGDIFSNTFRGFAGLLRASIPSANDLLDSLVKVTDEFAKWANSPKGQKEIKSFLEEAKESAKAVGDFIGEAFGLLQDLLNAGRDTGDSIFTDMADALERVRNFFKDNPDALKNFFTDVQEFATKVGHAIEDITDAIDKLDNPKTRKAAGFLVEAIGILAEGFAGQIIIFQNVASSIVGIFTGMAHLVIRAFELIFLGAVVAVKGIIDTMAKIPGPAGRAARAVQGAFDSSINNILDKFDAVDGQITSLEITANGFHPTMDVNTAPAVAKLTFLQSLIIKIQQMIANASANAPRSPNENNPSNTSSGSGSQPDPVPGGSDRRGRTSGNSITVNVTTPTVDPAAVATETVNRLVALGY